MPELSNITKEALRQIKESCRAKVAAIEGAGNVLKRMRYANNAGEWLKIATVKNVAGVNALRVCFIYFGGTDAERITARKIKPTVSVVIEVVHQFVDGTEEVNSTEDFEDFCGNLMDEFLDEESLGFTEGKTVINAPVRTEPGENEGRPVMVDGILAHRRLFYLDVSFETC